MDEKRTYGVLLRVYTPKAEEVAERVERALKHVRQILRVSKEFPALQRVVLLVPHDYDCGLVYRALWSRIATEWLKDFVAIYTPHGHHSCEVLNRGLTKLSRDVSHTVIISGKAMSYLTPSTMRAIDGTFADGAKVSGLAVDELRDIVLAGRIQNTFAAWENESLIKVGAFDSKLGVEEIAPLVRMVKKFECCIAPIDVVTGKLEVLASETALARHHEVMTTKIERQQQELKRVDSNFDEISAGIMFGYPQSI